MLPTEEFKLLSEAIAGTSVADSTEFTIDSDHWGVLFSMGIDNYIGLIAHLTSFFKEIVGELDAQRPSIENTVGHEHWITKAGFPICVRSKFFIQEHISKIITDILSKI